MRKWRRCYVSMVTKSKECLRQIHDLMPAAVSYKIATSYQFSVIKKRIMEKKWEYKGTVHQLFIDFKKAYDSVKRKLYDILIEFGIPKKLVRLIKMCLSETYSRVRIDAMDMELEHEDVVMEVEEMLMDIRAAFESLVKEAKWMDDKTRKEALLKVEAMGHMIGFPQNLLKHGYLEDLYSELKVEKGMFLKSVVNIHTVNANKALKSLTSPQQRRHNISSELPDPFVVNAYNVITHNFIEYADIVYVYGLCDGSSLRAIAEYEGRFPNRRVPYRRVFTVYGVGRKTWALNYGAIGFVLAHELTHSFDNKGRTFDKEGEQKNWWTQNTTIEFNKRADCFKKQYSSYKVQDRHINGRATLGENIADNGGLRESIRAYRNYVNRNGKEQKLPGLEHLSHEQLLYLSFANIVAVKGDIKRTF
ncbi:hypothetical protein ANN_09074 [Periplaneta americana]|uniref:Uncharacterized protein n=1 Tax=Periplaneta americana TaxID=6978 RepID=A0ABQ8TKJ4_PERAM|nr:hypothetical protein ANN_09074 [Periplaneta americana]